MFAALVAVLTPASSLAAPRLPAFLRERPSAPAVKADPATLVPAPRSVEPASGTFVVDARTLIVPPAGDAYARWAADYLSDHVFRARGLRLAVSEAPSSAADAIRFVRTRDASSPPEAYALEVAPSGVTISAASDAGLYYGAVTLWQLMTASDGPASSIALPGMKILDAPRYGWRGLALDSARHFQSPEFVEKLIDVMALHKLNVLHWHLTDDQGWRLEIKAYPRLTDVGAWRVPAGQGPAHDIDPKTGKPRLYGGFYTQDQVREIVRFAQARNVTIVPELDMPGHATAAIVAYPQLASIPNPPMEVPSDWGIYPNLYNVDDQTFAFVDKVLDEVMDLFPSRYIHVGGDEAVKDQWKASPAIQARMKALGLANEDALQSWFMGKLDAYLTAHGRRMVGWDEILQGGLSPNATVMSWRGVAGAVAAAGAGHDTVLAAWPILYFDNRVSSSLDQPPGRGAVVSLRDVYGFGMEPAGVTPSERNHLLGLEAEVWTEHIRTERRVEEMSFPRADAVAELGWSGSTGPDWSGFLARMPAEYARFRGLDIAADDGPFEPKFTERFDPATNAVTVSLSNQSAFGDIRYTLDGSEPTQHSKAFTTPLVLSLPSRLRARTFAGGDPLSPALERRYDALSVRTRDSRELDLCGNKVPLSLEDDAPVNGPRAVFLIDIENPCWIWKGADFSGVAAISARVGQVPFNFQIGKDIEAIKFRPPSTPDGELEVRIDGCDGARIAVLPLAPAVTNYAVTELPKAPIEARSGKHDLCFTFTQKSVDPEWAIETVTLAPAARAAKAPRLPDWLRRPFNKSSGGAPHGP